MSTFLQFGLLGLGTGAIYALITGGLVSIYRGSGLVNFAQGAYCLAGAAAYYQLRVAEGLPTALAFTLAVVITGLLGAATHLLILRRMRNSSPVVRVIATLGVLVVIQSAFVLHYGTQEYSVPSILPTQPLHVTSTISVGEDRVYLLVISLVVMVLSWSLYRFTAFGRATSAVAENYQVAASLGYSPDRIAALNWAIGGGLAGVAGILIAPITFIDPSTMVLLVLPALAGALLCRFRSFPLALLGALLVGVVQSWVERYVSAPGWANTVPFLLVTVLLVVRGEGLPLRSYVLDRLPAVSNGRLRPVPTLVAFAALGLAMIWLPYYWSDALTVTLAFGIVCVSVVVVTGLAGQLSLAQYVVGGTGAYAAAEASVRWQVPFLVTLLVGVAASAAIGLAVGVPALRTRGIDLAVVTLGLGYFLYEVVLSSSTEAQDGIQVPPPTAFGINLNPLGYPGRYAAFAVLMFAGVLVMVANLRRGMAGRHMIAVRSNERAAAATGVNVYGVKLYAFTVASGIAGLGACVYAFLQPAIVTLSFDVFSSINVVTVTVVGGIGTSWGALAGATLISGGISSEIVNGIHIGAWLPLIGGLTVLVVLIQDQNGILALYRRQLRSVARKVARSRSCATRGNYSANHYRPSAEMLMGGERMRASVGGEPRPDRIKGKTLSARNLTVSFGGVKAVGGVDIDIEPGVVHGLIGPNGAGKTTLIDAICGFVKSSSGSILLGGEELVNRSVRQRVNAGLSRSFQSVELFSGLTVRENLAIGSEHGGWRRYALDLVHPTKISLSPTARTAMARFGLSSELDKDVDSLPFGRRRLVAIARSVASAPSVLLLDEPAAGLAADERQELGQLIRWLADELGMAVVLVEHDVDLVLSTCDTITVLASGTVLGGGTPRTIRHDPIVMETFLGVGAGD